MDKNAINRKVIVLPIVIFFQLLFEIAFAFAFFLRLIAIDAKVLCDECAVAVKMQNRDQITESDRKEQRRKQYGNRLIHIVNVTVVLEYSICSRIHILSIGVNSCIGHALPNKHPTDHRSHLFFIKLRLFCSNDAQTVRQDRLHLY